MLAVLEAIARHQPIGVSALARIIGETKSAVQRSVTTLAQEGWIRSTGEPQPRWKLTPHILTVVHNGYMSDDLYQRARVVLDLLRDETGETTLLTVPDQGRFVIIDAAESRQLLRTVPYIGFSLPPRGSATGRAVLPYMSSEQQREVLGKEATDDLLAECASVLRSGYAVSDGEVIADSVNLAAPVFEADGSPAGAIVVTGPGERLTPEHHARIGGLLARAARSISRGVPAIDAAA